MYTNAMIREWIKRGYNNTMVELPHCPNPRFPPWWGWIPLIKSHQASLNRKDPSFYYFDVGEYGKYGYIWPTKVPIEYQWVSEPVLEKVAQRV
jgi:hypothetical protein